MSLAFSAVVLFLVFVPGIVFSRSYFSEPFSKAYIKSSFSDQVGFAVIPALILQAAMICMVEALTRYRIDFRMLGILVVGAHEERAQAAAFENLQYNLAPIALYNIILWTAAFLLGHCGRWIVIAREWDTRYPLLRFDNEWFYFLTGREWRLKSGVDYDVVWLDALISNGSTNVIFSGIFQSFQMSSEGSLNSICLSRAQKWTEDHEAPVPIAGKGLILKYEEILNLNISFYFAAEEDVGDTTEQKVASNDGE